MTATLDSTGAMRITLVDGSTKVGVYAINGSINVYDATGASKVGVYHPCGALNIYVVDGSSYVGKYALNGALNVIEDSSSKGTHPSGATLVTGIGSSIPAILVETGNPLMLETSAGFILLE